MTENEKITRKRDAKAITFTKNEDTIDRVQELADTNYDGNWSMAARALIKEALANHTSKCKHNMP